MNRKWYIAAFICIAVGVCIMGMTFLILGLGEATANNDTIYIADDFDSLEIEARDFNVTVGFTDGESRILFTCSTAHRSPRYEVEEGRLRIWVPDESFADWSESLFASNAMTLLLNKEHYGSLSVKADSGSFRTEGDLIRYDTVRISAKSGRVTLSAVPCPFIQVESTSGEIAVAGLKGRSLSLISTSGRIRAEGCEMQEISAQSTSGEIAVAGLKGRSLSLISTSGRIRAEGCEMQEISAKTKSGSVNIVLLSPMKLILSSQSGRIVQPELSGEGRCTVETGSGDITVSYSK